MEDTKVKNLPLMQKHQSSSTIQTTLYKLIETVIEVADPEEGKLVNEVTINILSKAKQRVCVSQSLND